MFLFADRPLDHQNDVMFETALKTARKVVILVIGSTVVLFGVVLIFIPGPAFVVIPVGLAILALEFAWAKNLLDRLKARLNTAKDGLFGPTPPPAP